MARSRCASRAYARCSLLVRHRVANVSHWFGGNVSTIDETAYKLSEMIILIFQEFSVLEKGEKTEIFQAVWIQ